jgi:hypothetical protein
MQLDHKVGDHDQYVKCMFKQFRSTDLSPFLWFVNLEWAQEYKAVTNFVHQITVKLKFSTILKSRDDMIAFSCNQRQQPFIEQPKTSIGSISIVYTNLSLDSSYFSIHIFCFAGGDETDFFIQSTIPSQSVWEGTHAESSSEASSAYEWGDRRFPWVWQAFIVLQCSASSSLMFRNTSYKFSGEKGTTITEGNDRMISIHLHLVVLWS